MSSYYFKDYKFVIEGYQTQKPFASFLPGVAGVKGTPIWVYYVNRGQGIASFGIEDKDGSILDFVPANQGYQRTALKGFRTFLKIDGKYFEAFSPLNKDTETKMWIEENAFGLEEYIPELELTVQVKYFTVTEEPFGGLVRKVKLINTSGAPRQVEVLDGLATFWPYKNTNDATKNISNLAVAWFEVDLSVEHFGYYKNRSTTNDDAKVGVVTEGHFYGAISDEGPMDLVYDLELIFGQDTSLMTQRPLERDSFMKIKEKHQHFENKMPGAFSLKSFELIEESKWYSISGKMVHIDKLREKSAEFTMEYFEHQENAAKAMMDGILKDVDTVTAYSEFDGYIKQSYLDNFLRGGYPLKFENENGNLIYHVYSRIHGDMEREYNAFNIEPAFYSHGVGNFRDVNQNRRNDVFFTKEAGLFNIIQFTELLAMDGTNPLVVEGNTFVFPESKKEEILHYVSTSQEDMAEFLSKSFTPGSFLNFIYKNDIQLTVEADALLKKVLYLSKCSRNASFREGLWSDHWTYNMDLIENYESVFPDRLEALFFDTEVKAFQNPEVILPMNQKIVLTEEGKVRQYNAIHADPVRLELLKMDEHKGNWHHNQDNSPVTISVFSKYFSLVLNKFASLDPENMGIMMDTDKPGWNDAMNGLPGLMGSGVSETIELKRLASYLQKIIVKYRKNIKVPSEVYEFYTNLMNANDFSSRIAAKEQYFENQSLKLKGKCNKIPAFEVDTLLTRIIDVLNQGIEKARAIGNGILPSYFTYEAVEFDLIEGCKHPINGLPLVKVHQWKSRALPLFLEAPARELKAFPGNPLAVETVERIKNSELYDDNLGMYVTSEPLENESMEIGRIRAFTPGWLERESVFLHMEFKYLLGILKSGQQELYYETIMKALPPFMNPETYGRSTLENSSFIASSRNPNPDTHGRGFVSRLTGTTSEVISMWMHMMGGTKIFTFEEGVLEFALKPVLHQDFFNEENQVKFTLFKRTQVVYKNPRRKHTFSEGRVVPKSYALHAGEKVIKTDTVTGELAENLRNGCYDKVEVELNYE